MKKQLGASFLLAGTAIGSGMLSLPMVLAKFGIFNSVMIMFAFAVLTYFSALIRADLNINSRSDASLKDVGIFFHCPKIGTLGDILLKLLHFSLMAAYVSGISSMINAMCNNTISFPMILTLFSIGIIVLLSIFRNLIIHINKFLFIVMFSSLLVVVIGLFLQTKINTIPQSKENIPISEWTTLVPIIFTSFGFQGSIHSMVKFCHNDKKLIKTACLWGSLTPAFVYIIWTIAILLVVFNTDIQFFHKMAAGQISDVGQLISVLSHATAFKSLQTIIWSISLLSILTSVLGVGLSLLDIVEKEWKIKQWQTISIVVGLPALLSFFIPNAFVRILNIAGIILAFMAIIVPIIISRKMQKDCDCQNLLLKNKVCMLITLLCGIMIILLGVWDLIKAM
jgi:tyrosine-specific transport protein